MTSKDIKERIGRYVKVEIESFHAGARGGGLLYFGVDSLPGERKKINSQILILWHMLSSLMPTCALYS